MDKDLKNVVTTAWSEGDGETVNPPFPEACCHCLKPATDTLEAHCDGVTLNLPYCDKHIDSSRAYHYGVVHGRKRRIFKVISQILGALAGFWIVFYVLPESDIMRGGDSIADAFGAVFGITVEPSWNFELAATPLWFRLILSVVFSLIMLKIIPYLLDRWVLHKGADDYGYWINRKVTLFVAPGIMNIAIDRKKDPEGRTLCSIAFLTKEYADLFRDRQEEKRLI